MKLPFESWATRDKFTFFFCGSALLTIAIVYMSLHLSNPKITSKQYLEFFNGTLTEHHYYHSSRGARDCWFKIKGCSDDFVIDGNNLKAFDISGFENLFDGDSVIIGVSKRDFSRVNSGMDEIFIYSLSTTNRTFLDYKDSLQNYNNNHIYYICTVLLISSLMLIYLGCISKVKSLI